MPNKNTHAVVGLVSGVAIGGIAAVSAPEEYRAIEVAFAGLGGMFGGIAPDVLEPAASPRHRAICHSILVGGAGVIAGVAHLRAYCAENASGCETRAAAATPGSALANSEWWKAFAWRASGAFAFGFAAGYASHLMLDGDTPDGIPLVVRGL